MLRIDLFNNLLFCFGQKNRNFNDASCVGATKVDLNSSKSIKISVGIACSLRVIVVVRRICCKLNAEADSIAKMEVNGSTEEAKETSLHIIPKVVKGILGWGCTYLFNRWSSKIHLSFSSFIILEANVCTQTWENSTCRYLLSLRMC